MVTVIIIENHVGLRTVLKAFLEREPDIQVVGEAAGCQHALNIVRECQAQVAILDLGLEDCSGLELIKPIHTLSPITQVIVYTLQDSPLYLEVALAASANGFLSKSAPAIELLNTIRKLASRSNQEHRSLD